MMRYEYESNYEVKLVCVTLIQYVILLNCVSLAVSVNPLYICRETIP